MSEAVNPLATALGTYYPKHYVVAVFDDPAGASRARDALMAAGFAEAAAEICPGPEFVKNWNDFMANRGLLQRAAGLFPSDEREAVEEYLVEAERGASFVTVLAPERADRDRARDLLKADGGHAMRYYGDNTVTDLR